MKKISSWIMWAFVVAFIIVTNLFLYYTVDFIKPEPRFENFCEMRSQEVNYTDAEMCVNAGGQWTNYPLSPKEITQAITTETPTGWCDADFTCRQEYETQKSVYNKNLFIAMMIVSLILLVAGIIVPIQALSLGMAWSGVLALIISTIRFWSDASNIMKVIILGIGLIVLTWLAVKKLNQKE
jgi:hypothetical protein